MSRADELLAELVAAWEPEDGLRFVTAIRKARAYLNEKPHEPSTDNGFRMALNIRPLPESPPHAAAEPEKPPRCKRCGYEAVTQCWNCGCPNAYPSAQPIGPSFELWEELIGAVAKKFPGETRHQTALRYIREREAPNNDQKDALKSAGKESA